MRKSNNLNEFISQRLLKLTEKGYKEVTVRNYKRTYDLLLKFCSENNLCYYDESIGEAFIAQVEKRTKASDKGLRVYRYHIAQLNCPLENVRQVCQGRRPHQYVSSCYDDIVLTYEKYLYTTGKSEKDVRRRTHVVARFLRYVEQRNVVALNNLSVADVYSAFEDSSDKNSFRRLVTPFLKYGFKYKLISVDLSAYMPTAVRHKAIPSVYSKEEVEQLLESIDRKADKGKRDYAILLIAARLGLRASDISSMTFDCICEFTSTIKIVQKKTKKLLQLPVSDEIHAAIYAYINDARPSSDDKHIFLNCDGLNPISPTNIGQIVKLKLNRLEIDCTNKRKGSHSLRASLATALLDEGNDYSTIQKVLGQSNIESTKSYVKANVNQLRVNALRVPPPSSEFKTLIMGGSQL